MILNSDSVSLILVKTSGDLSFLSQHILTDKVFFTPQLKLLNAELNIAVDISLFCYSLAAKKVHFCFSTLYVKSATSYPLGYHRSLLQKFQFAWHPPYIQFFILKIFSNSSRFIFDPFCAKLLQSSISSYLARL